MSKDQKETRLKIGIIFVLFAFLMVLSHIGFFESWPRWGEGLLYAIPYFLIGYESLFAAVRNIKKGEIFDENFLMSLATLAAFVVGKFPEGVAVMLFYRIGEFFQDYAVGRSRDSIAQMMSIVPDFANLEMNGEIKKVDPEEVEIGETIVIRPGERIPLDGEVLSGESFVDTAALTGESVPRKVRAGDAVVSGCVNGEGTLRVRTSKIYDDSTVAKILELVENASEKKAKAEKFISRFAHYYTPIVTIAAVLLAVVPPFILGGSREIWMDWIVRACTFLIVSCPCALVISVPLGFFGGIGAASRIGVLVKGANYLELVANLKTIVFDKTGTLTKGEFCVQSLNATAEFGEEKLLELATLGEMYSTHPIAKSIVAAYGKMPDGLRVENTQEIAGRGIRATVDGKELLLGNESLLRESKIAVTAMKNVGTIVYVAYAGSFAGSIVIADSIKDGAVEAISSLKKEGVDRSVMLTGDHVASAIAIAEKLNVNDVYAELLPTDKVTQIEKLLQNSSQSNRVGFVGDGINDAPVLMRADVGFAMGAFGSDAAIEAADIVLMDDDIRKIPEMVRIAKRTLCIVRENVAFALGIKALILIFGALGYANMWMAVFGDVGVSVLAVLNSMRALRVGK